ncbi:MAG: hypothetical protein M3198_11785 [Actinomycetota bacterium]|nr:hypothetical protein [Actinomycetota bacterium]
MTRTRSVGIPKGSLEEALFKAGALAYRMHTKTPSAQVIRALIASCQLA